jgi:hypothetical protein
MAVANTTPEELPAEEPGGRAAGRGPGGPVRRRNAPGAQTQRHAQTAPPHGKLAGAQAGEGQGSRTHQAPAPGTQCGSWHGVLRVKNETR